jgi:uncharacterized protein (TIGR02594 family)
MTPEAYNRSRLNRTWSLLSLPHAWPGQGILEQADTGSNLTIGEVDVDKVDWKALSAAVGHFQATHSAQTPDSKLGPDTLSRMVRQFEHRFPAPDVSAIDALGEAAMCVAESQLGVTENASAVEHNPVILNYSREAGFHGIVDDETHWCSIYANWCALKAGRARSEQATARSWLDVGEGIDEPRRGDVVIFWREAVDSWKGHVAFFHSRTDNSSSINVLGGNQNNRVCVMPYSRAKLLGFRRLPPAA